MNKELVRELVENKRTSLLQDRDTIEEAVTAGVGLGNTIAQGLLVLERTTEAMRWFSALHNQSLRRGNKIWDTMYKKNNLDEVRSEPWSKYHTCILTGLFGGRNINSAAQTIYGRATEPFIDELEYRTRTHRIDLVGLVSGFLLEDADHEAFLRSLQQYVDQNGSAWDRDRYLPYIKTMRGLSAEDAEVVRDGLNGLLVFHEEQIIGARDVDAVDEAFASDAAGMLVLARREGMDIDIDSEYIPAALTDEEYYPLGGGRIRS